MRIPISENQLGIIVKYINPTRFIFDPIRDSTFRDGKIMTFKNFKEKYPYEVSFRNTDRIDKPSKEIRNLITNI